MEQHGYGAIHIQWYKTMSSFHHQRIPLVILLAGTGMTGKSTMATRLSERLNLSSVLKTDVIYDLMHTIIDGSTPPRVWEMNGDCDSFLETMTKECQLVYQGLDTDVCKSIADGKSVIIEGDLVDQRLLLGLLQGNDSNKEGQHCHQKRAIVVPLLLVIPDKATHQDLVQQSPHDAAANLNQKDLVDRMHAWQDKLVNTNKHLQTTGQPHFQVIEMDMDRLPAILDHVQALVLERITLQMS
ncbi:unnamed protein product [Absidia cylindrospora]